MHSVFIQIIDQSQLGCAIFINDSVTGHLDLYYPVVYEIDSYLFGVWIFKSGVDDFDKRCQ